MGKVGGEGRERGCGTELARWERSEGSEVVSWERWEEGGSEEFGGSGKGARLVTWQVGKGGENEGEEVVRSWQGGKGARVLTWEGWERWENG